MDSRQLNSFAGELETTLDLLGALVAEVQQSPTQQPSGRVQELCTTLSYRPNLAGFSKVLLRAHAEIAEALGGIRLTRETIKAHAVQPIHDTHDKLKEVTSATESAAIEMLNGLDRTLATIDELQKATASTSHSVAEGFDALRAEVNQLYNCLQFQDITAQQMRGAGQLLNDVEARIEGVAALFDQAMGGAAEPGPGPNQSSREVLSFNPDATMRDAGARQAQIDAAFQVARQSDSETPGCLRNGMVR
jgi:chemotaxis regulatin CheY-phosphate phosphatase CheZ